jgi:hypothetical protein
MSELPGFVRGQHYATYVGEVERLGRATRGVAAERLLLELVDATEAEAQATKVGVAPWYYEQLANLYQRRGNRGAEQAILARFCRQRAAHSPMRRQLAARLKAVMETPIPVGATRVSPPGWPRPSPPRTCALPGCAILLTRTQMKFCSREHADTALRERLSKTRGRAPGGSGRGAGQKVARDHARSQDEEGSR